MKKIKIGVFITFIVIIGGYGLVKELDSKKDLTVFALANVEALADGETTTEICASLWGKCINNLAGPYIRRTSFD